MPTVFNDLNNSTGHVLVFTYAGGTTPFTTRTVFVTEIGPYGNINGWDFDKKDIRQFKQHKMTDVLKLDDGEVTVVNLKLLPKAFRDGKQLEKQFLHDGKQVYVNTNGHYLIAIDTVGTHFNITRRVSGITLSVSGKNGMVNIEIPNDRDTVVSTFYPVGHSRGMVYRDTTVEKLGELINKAVS